jgi:D-2-hydroxyacid dehydrogenase (NADP+)
MSDINVLVTLGLEQEVVDRIRAVDSRLKVTVSHWRELFEEGDPHKALAPAEVLLSWSLLPPDLEDRAPNLRWVQLISAGVDRLLSNDLLRSGVIVTTASGIHAAPMREHVLGMMIMLAKGWPGLLRAQAKREWKRSVPDVLAGKTVGIVGLGNIGCEVARVAKAFDMRVLGVRRSGAPIECTDYEVDGIFGPLDILNVLSESDYVVLALPLTEETHHMIGELALRSMKPTAYLINASRGAVVDEAALVRALKEGEIAGAGLDVFESEPLPRESELWGMENVIISPHIGGGTPVYMEQAVEIFCENLRRYLAGKPLRNVVDLERGY